jgi:hypothetical protein
MVASKGRGYTYLYQVYSIWRNKMAVFILSPGTKYIAILDVEDDCIL